MHEEPLLSVIIPSFNMEDYLAACCDSLLVEEARLRRLEVLIVNDGSTDRTSAIAHDYQRRHPASFRVIDKENGHYGSCVNRALGEARGLYVKILDADDAYDTAHLSLLLETLERIAESGDVLPDLIISDSITVNPEGDKIGEARPSLPASRILPVDLLQKRGFVSGLHAIAYRTDCPRGQGHHQTEGICYTDTEWAILPLLGVNTAYYFPYVIYRYQVGREGQSVDPKVFRKNFWMLDRVVRNIVKSFGTSISSGEGTSFRYFTFCVEDLLLKYYQYAFSFLSRRELNRLLPAFDEYFEKTAPELYRSLGQKPISHLVDFHFIAHWRRKKRVGLLSMSLIRSGRRMIQVLYWLRGALAHS